MSATRARIRQQKLRADAESRRLIAEAKAADKDYNRKEGATGGLFSRFRRKGRPAEDGPSAIGL